MHPYPFISAARTAAAGVFLFAALSVISLVATAGTVWFADGKNLNRLDTVTQQIALTVKNEDVGALAVSADGSAWALGKKHLVKYALNGTVANDIVLKDIGLKSAGYLALDGRDQSLWIAEGKGDDENDDDDSDGHAKRIVRLDGAGQRAQDFASPGRIRALVLGLDQSLWLLGNKTLWHYSRAGNQLAAIELKPLTNGTPKLLALDPLGVWLWMGADKQLIRVDGDTPSTAPLKMTLAKDVELLTIDPRTGELWAATEQMLYQYADNGALKKSIDLKALNLKDVKSLAFDSANQALWLGHDKGITRFAVDGTKLFTMAVKEKVEAIGVAPFALSPTLEILAPTTNQLTNDPQPLLKVKAAAVCNAEPCAFSVGYFDSYRLSAKLDGLEIGSLFTHQPGTSESTHRPATPLPDGTHVFTAQATDSFGQSSLPREARFTVDTTAPVFGGIIPADGSVFRLPNQTLTGTVSETAVIRLDGPGTSLTANGMSFSFPVVINEGQNRFTLRATDAAGNASDKSVGYTLDSVAPKFLTIAPADNTVANTPNITISVTVDESAAIHLNGDGVALTADGTAFSFPVTLKSGLNTYALMATDRAGNQVTATIRLTLQSAALPFKTLAPADGAIFAKSNVVIAGSLAEPANFKLTGEGVTLTARGAQFSFPVTLKVGVNTFHVTATTAAGGTAAADITLTFAPVTINVTSPVDITSTTDESITVAGTVRGRREQASRSMR